MLVLSLFLSSHSSLTFFSFIFLSLSLSISRSAVQFMTCAFIYNCTVTLVHNNYTTSVWRSVWTDLRLHFWPFSVCFCQKMTKIIKRTKKFPSNSDHSKTSSSAHRLGPNGYSLPGSSSLSAELFWLTFLTLLKCS